MTYSIRHDPIWGEPWEADGYVSDETGEKYVEDSPRMGGKYKIHHKAADWLLNSLDLKGKAQLTTWVIDQRRLYSEPCPTITEAVIDYARNPDRRLLTSERAKRLLCGMAEEAEPGEEIYLRGDLPSDPKIAKAYAWSESTKEGELRYFLKYLRGKSWIEPSRRENNLFAARITIEGYSEVEEIRKVAASSQVFVAMWLDTDMNDAYDLGIKPGIEEAGYRALRIDRKPDVQRIDDAILAEIKRSRFIVADFTSDKGMRGAVYYEAGFAFGLGKPVIYCAREGTELAFDTRQEHHIFWRSGDYDGLRKAVRDRILALMDAGPNAPA